MDMAGGEEQPEGVQPLASDEDTDSTPATDEKKKISETLKLQ